MDKNTGIAISWLITRTFIMACIMVIGRVMGLEGMNSYSIIFWQNMMAFVFMMGFCLHKKEFPRTEKYGLHTLRCSLGMCSGLVLFYCLPLMQLNTATAITFTGPLFSTVAAMIFLREKTTIHRTIGLIVGFSGVLIILQPWNGEMNPFALVLLLTPLIWGLTDVTIKKLITTETTQGLLFYMVIIMAVLSIPIGVYHWHTPSFKELALCSALALFHLGNFTTISKAFKRADISVLMPFEFFRLIFASIFAYLIFFEELSFEIICGSLVILGSSIYVVRKEKHHAPKN